MRPYFLLALAVLVALGAWLARDSLLLRADTVPSSEWPRTDFSRLLVDLGEIRSGGPPKDGIPAIDQPAFERVDAADAWLDPREPLIVVSMNAQARGYPLQILIYHEIVNDKFAEVPVAVTFCPLCNAAIVFDRRVEGKVLDFGTTGKLRKSDLVMYDRQTESWWQQFTGRAIVGELAGTRLQRLAAVIVSYADFREAYPGGEILSRKTGYRRPYGRNPYRGYDRIGDRPFLFDDPVDPRLPAMERVLNATIAGRHRLYPFSVLAQEPVINDELAGKPLVVLSREGTLSVLDQAEILASRTVPSAAAYSRQVEDRVLEFVQQEGELRDRQTGSRWDLFGRALDGPLTGHQLEPVEGGVHFAFAWLAFNPDSAIYSPDTDTHRENVSQ